MNILINYRNEKALEQMIEAEFSRIRQGETIVAEKSLQSGAWQLIVGMGSVVSGMALIIQAYLSSM
ncbi:MAG: hypothetical protein KDJ65_28525 [Anaerolineae bacterium]|nr:hypothetical protein [Anaerolineae bacterium]